MLSCFGNSSRVKKFKNKLKNFKNVVKVKNDYKKCKRLRISTHNNKAFLLLNFNGNTINYAFGRTNVNARRKGYGTMLRAIPILAAKNSGFRYITHTGVFVNENNTRGTPPSTRIVRGKLGFKPKYGYANEKGDVPHYSVLNLKNVNIKKMRDYLIANG